MVKYHNIEELLEANSGIIKVSMVRESGIDKTIFYNYIKQQELTKIGPGIYACPSVWEDDLYTLHLRFSQLIYSHETALYLHDLTDREPFQPVITVKTGYNPSVLRAEGVKVHTIKASLYDVGMSMVKSNFNRWIPVYDMERTVCDIVRNRNNMDIEVFQNALKRYVKKQNKNLHKLNEYAEQFRVNKILKHYLEVLL